MGEILACVRVVAVGQRETMDLLMNADGLRQGEGSR